MSVNNQPQGPESQSQSPSKNAYYYSNFAPSVEPVKEAYVQPVQLTNNTYSNVSSSVQQVDEAYVEPVYDPQINNQHGVYEFSEQTIRRAFVRKVYSILMLQLTVTIGIIALFLYYHPLRIWTRKHIYVYYIALGITFVTVIALSCCVNVRRRTPQNYIFLSIFTLAESFVLGTISSIYATEVVLLALGTTAIVCLALTIFAFQTKWDFTMLGGILMVALIVFFIFGILMIFFRNRFPILSLVYSGCGTLLFCFFLIYDTQLMLGGTHKCSISPEEYVFAALSLYLDIVNIFTFILSITGRLFH